MSTFPIVIGWNITASLNVYNLYLFLICRVRDDIFHWRVREDDSAAQKDFVTPQFDEKGRAFVEAEGRRKTSRATVRISKPGAGQVWLLISDLQGSRFYHLRFQVEISHEDRPELVYDISYFYALKDRHQLLFPLQVA